jgi:hypothetical protein
LFRRWPFNWLASKYGLHVLFLFPKLKWKYSDDVLFTITPMGLNQSRFVVDKLMTTFPHLIDKVFFYKMNKNIRITRMEEEFVPHQYSMEIIGHKDLICYEKKKIQFFFLLYISFIKKNSSHVCASF